MSLHEDILYLFFWIYPQAILILSYTCTERLKSVLEEVKQAEGRIILFIDEIHTVLGAGELDGHLLVSADV